MQRRRPAARVELEARLFPHAHVRLGRAAIRLELEGQRQPAEEAQRGRSTRLELAALHARDPRDEREVVVRPTLLGTVGDPRTDLTVLDRLRIAFRGHVARRPQHRRRQLIPHETEVGRVVVHAEDVLGMIGIRRDDAEELRRAALRDGQHVGVETKLEDRTGAGLARELGVGDFVGPGTELAGSRDLQQYVGASEPLPLHQGTLDDDAGASVHRFGGLDDCVEWVLKVFEIGDGAAGGLQGRYVRLLVFEAASVKEL